MSQMVRTEEGSAAGSFLTPEARTQITIDADLLRKKHGITKEGLGRGLRGRGCQ